MRKRKEPLLGVSPQGDPGIVHRTLVRLCRGITPIESKSVFDAAVAAITKTSTGPVVPRVRALIKEAPNIPDIHHQVHSLLNEEDEGCGFTLPHVYGVRFSFVREYSPSSFEKLKSVLPTKNGCFILIIAKGKSGNWMLIA